MHYIFAVLHSPAFRARYREFLKRDFPHIPLTQSKEMFRSLVTLGQALVDLHLISSPLLDEPITTCVGDSPFQVEKATFSDNTVWIDKARTRGFKGVPEDVWNFHVGGYQVCEKWLKDRQAKGGKNSRPGRLLTDEDIDHYQKIICALSETIRIMAEIDEVIEQHGGWPDAFAKRSTGTESSSIDHNLDLQKAAEDPAEYDDS
jgi:predicted helicase